jgi:hypothetical protein
MKSVHPSTFPFVSVSLSPTPVFPLNITPISSLVSGFFTTLNTHKTP